MTDTILHIHNAAMDLVDIAQLKKAKDGDNTNYLNYLKAAYELEIFAAQHIQDLTNGNDRLWKVSILRSAGFLALNCGFFHRALSLAELGLQIPTDEYELSKLKDLKKIVKQKLMTTSKELVHSPNIIQGTVSAVDIGLGKINIEEDTSKKQFSLSVSREQILQVVRYFLGDFVEIEFQNDEKGNAFLKYIRLAA